MGDQPNIAGDYAFQTRRGCYVRGSATEMNLQGSIAGPGEHFEVVRHPRFATGFRIQSSWTGRFVTASDESAHVNKALPPGFGAMSAMEADDSRPGTRFHFHKQPDGWYAIQTNWGTFVRNSCSNNEGFKGAGFGHLNQQGRIAGEGELFNFHCQVNRAVAIPPPRPREEIPAPPTSPAARQAAIDTARKALGIAMGQRSVGVVGMTGSGKSALVNALRGVADTAPEAAQEGIVETTRHGTPYPWVRECQRAGQQLVLWDLPGGDTTLFDGHSYFSQQKLCAFHLLLLVTSGRYKDGENKIVQQALAWHIPLVVVQTKADLAVESEVDMAESRGVNVQDSGSLSFITEKTISRLRGDIHTKSGHTTLPVYVVGKSRASGQNHLRALREQMEQLRRFVCEQ